MLQLPLHLFRIPDAFAHIKIAAKLHAMPSLLFLTLPLNHCRFQEVSYLFFPFPRRQKPDFLPAAHGDEKRGGNPFCPFPPLLPFPLL